ncbi:hypothetical protein [Rufibacter roseus]|uniref:Uncharacterized protein n=1 Tax=Rufibacter roseus TaxID=1567108 RepID=A0ABW2DHQ5_9BACT|nr:hypothetical protein [Rufibacter roseus]
MKKTFFVFALAAGMMTFATSCESNREENTGENVEEVGDDVEDAADEVEDETREAVDDNDA